MACLNQWQIVIFLLCVTQISRPFKIVGYWYCWSVYRPEPMGFVASATPNPRWFTHLVYAAAEIDEKKMIMQPTYPPLDIKLGAYSGFLNLTKRNPYLKRLIMVTNSFQANDKTDIHAFSQMTSTPANREIFVKSVLDFLDKHRFDGIVLAWKWPGVPEKGGNPADKVNYVSLIRELSGAMKPRKKLLNIYVSANETRVKLGYDVPNIVPYVDEIHVQTFRMWAPEGKTKTEVHSRLSNFEKGLALWHKLGAPKDKLIAGLSFQGMTFRLKDSKKNQIGSPAVGDGPEGPYTGLEWEERGNLAYYEICTNKNIGGYKKIWDQQSYCPYAYKNRIWVGFDDERSLAIKTANARYNRYGGVFMYSVDTDDFRGVCGNGKYPLTRAVVYGA